MGKGSIQWRIDREVRADEGDFTAEIGLWEVGSMRRIRENHLIWPLNGQL
jgi:hypothetical protein